MAQHDTEDKRLFIDSDGFSDCTDIPYSNGTSIETHSKPKHSPLLERQDSVELEYHDSMTSPEDAKNLMGSLSAPDLKQPVIADTSLKKKIKKKRRFQMFYRREKDKLDTRLTESLPVQPQKSFLSKPSYRNSGNWGSSELRKSNNSLYSVSDADSHRAEEEDDLVETLMNPSPTPDVNEKNLKIPVSVEHPPTEYMVNITLMSGHNLAIRDRTGSSDPYVKFKCRPFKYRSNIKYRNLNPEWNEHFSFRTNDLTTPMLVRVYDHDYGSLDDFMGGQTLDLSSYVDKEQHIVELGLEDANIKYENLGYLRLCIKITLLLEDEKEESKKPGSCSSNVWDSILTCTLLKGSNLPPMDANGLSDPYCKFKLGTQKFKSATCSKTLNPKWMERFELRMYDGDSSNLHVEVWDRDFPQNDDFIGGCSVDLSTLARDVTHHMTLPLVGNKELEDSEATIRFALCITRTTVEAVENERSNRPSYGMLNSLDIKAIKEKNVGHLYLKINRAVDLGATCNSFVLVEMGHSCVKTPMVGKTSSPEWNKSFNLTVRDIHEELELQVYKVSSRGNQLLGMIKTPLHRLREGCHQYALKDKHTEHRARGIIYIETELVYNPVRAMIRTINPREDKLLEAEQKFKRKVLIDNIKRVANVIRSIIATLEFIKSTWSWENKVLSSTAFLVFLVATIFGELWMAFFVFMLVFLYQYLVVYIKNDHVWQKAVSNNIHTMSLTHATSDSTDCSDFSDLEDEKTNLREKFRQFQQILVIVQNVLGIIADEEERVRNLFYWRVPFLSWMAIIVLAGAGILLYFVPLRYVILVWGINKYTKRLRNPNFIDNNELLDFLSRSPTNRQFEQWRELSMVVHSKQALDKKSYKKQKSTIKKKTN